MAGVFAQYHLYVDWDNDGFFDSPLEDITAYAQDLSWDRGFKGAPPEHATSSSLTATLKNGDGRFSSENTASPLYGLILPILLTRVTMTIGSDPERTMWQGYLQTIDSEVGEVVPASTAQLTAYGPLAQFVDGDINIPLKIGIRTGAAVAALLDADGFVDSDFRDLDLGQTYLSLWWIRQGQSRLQALNDLADAELGKIGETKDGKVFFHDRHHIFEQEYPFSESIPPPRVVYGSGGLTMWHPSIINPLPGVYNLINAYVRSFNLSEESTLVTITDIVNGQGGRPIPIPPGGSDVETVVWIELSEKFSPAEFLAVNTWTLIDYVANTQEDGLGINITEFVSAIREEYGQRVKVTFFNDHSETAYLTVLRAHGIAVVESDPAPIVGKDDVSQGKYRRREYPYPSQWITDLGDGQAIIDYIVDTYKDPRARVSYDLMANKDLDHLQEAQDIDVDDRIQIDDSSGTFGLYVNEHFIIDRLVHHVSLDAQGGLHVVSVECTVAPMVELPATTNIRSPINSGGKGPPDGLYVNALDPRGRVIIGVVATKWGADVFEGEIRAKFYPTGTPEFVDLRTVAEGGTLVHNGVTELVITGLFANQNGVNYEFLHTQGPGRWYYAGRLRNKTYGWSLWSDGNSRPLRVVDYVNVQGGPGDIDKPENSTVRASLIAGGVVVKVTRPTINGINIIDVYAQVRNAKDPDGRWFDLDENTGPAVTYYDGSTVDHIYNKKLGTLTAPDSTGLGGASPGDLILLDVFDDSDFDVQNCQWAIIPEGGINGNVISGVQNFRPYPPPDSLPNIWNHIKIKIVKPPWEWNTHGYLGDAPSKGVAEVAFYWNHQKGDQTSNEFTLPIIDLPENLIFGDIRARVWCENKVCRADCGRGSRATLVDVDNPSGASGLQIVTHEMDPTVPAGMMKFRWYRDTENFRNIYVVVFWLSHSLPAQGPFSMERSAYYSQSVIEEGVVDIVAGELVLHPTRASNPDVVGKVFLIFTDDSDPDNDIDGNTIQAQGLNSITLHDAFEKTGSGYNYAIIEPWWDPSLSVDFKYYFYTVPDDIGNDIEAEEWESPVMPLPTFEFFVTGCSRNPFGLGTRMTASKTAEADESTGSIIARGGYVVRVQDEGLDLALRGTIDFVGSGVSVEDDPVNRKSIVTIPGGAGGDWIPFTPTVTMPLGGGFSSMNVDSAAYLVQGNVMTVRWAMTIFDIVDVPLSAPIDITIDVPGGYVANGFAGNPVGIYESSGQHLGIATVGIVTFDFGKIDITKLDTAYFDVGSTYLIGQLTFGIET